MPIHRDLPVVSAALRPGDEAALGRPSGREIAKNNASHGVIEQR